MAEEPTNQEPAPALRNLTIDYRVPDDVVPQYATHVLVQPTQHEFLLFFFNIRPPVVIGPAEEVLRKAETINTVPANLISALVISPARIPEIIQALLANWQNFQARMEAATSEEDTEDVTDPS